MVQKQLEDALDFITNGLDEIQKRYPCLISPSVVRTLVELIIQEQKRILQRPTGTIEDARDMMREISKIVDQYTELQKERPEVTDEDVQGRKKI